MEDFPLGSACPHTSRRGCTFPFCQIKLICDRAVTLAHHFKSLLQQDRTKEITLS